MRSVTRVIAVVVPFNLVIGAAVWTSRPVLAQQREPSGTTTHEARVISALNDCIQERFKDVNERFGMARMMKPGDAAHRFRPENVREMAAVRNLEQSHLQVVFYLVGRAVLRPMPGPGYWAEKNGRRIIKGPVEITSSGTRNASNDAMPPQPRDLWDDSRRAMRAFSARESHEFVNSGWNFVARPVRASDEVCLRCHAGGTGPALELGDAIGAAIYGYRTVR
jgi:hypothetical protein